MCSSPNDGRKTIFFLEDDGLGGLLPVVAIVKIMEPFWYPTTVNLALLVCNTSKDIKLVPIELCWSFAYLVQA